MTVTMASAVAQQLDLVDYITGLARPARIQLKRKKGWKMPPDAVPVARPGLYGNPFWIEEWAQKGVCRDPVNRWLMTTDVSWTLEELLSVYRAWVQGLPIPWPYGQPLAREQGAHLPVPPTRDQIAALRGRRLACWCSLDQPCHADVLLDLANPQQVPA